MSRGTWIIIVVLIVVGGVLYFLLNIGGKKVEPLFPVVEEQRMGEQIPAMSGEGTPDEIPLVENLVVSVPKHAWKRNPFFPFFKPVKQSEMNVTGEVGGVGNGIPRLQGIVWSERGGKALLGGELVGKGEVVSGWKVLRVGKASVTLVSGNRKVTLRLFNIKGKVKRR